MHTNDNIVHNKIIKISSSILLIYNVMQAIIEFLKVTVIV